MIVQTMADHNSMEKSGGSQESVIVTCKLDVAGDYKLQNVIFTLSNSSADALNVCESMKHTIKCSSSPTLLGSS